jgi:hypothetical protein
VKRRIAAIVVLAAGLAGPALAVSPASAGNGTSSVGCSTGDSCTALLQKMVTFGGRNYDLNGGGNTVVDITPPPCLWEPIGDAQVGSQAIIDQFGTNPPDLYQISKSVAQARTLLTTPAPGQWYELPVNPADNAAAAQECLQLPLFAWVTPGNAPPGLNLPPETLARLSSIRPGPPTPTCPPSCG